MLSINFNQYHYNSEDLEKLKPSITEFTENSEEEIEDIWQKRALLFVLLSDMPAATGMQSWKNTRILKILENPKLLDQLNVTLSLEKIKDIYDRFQIIALRPCSQHNLMLFCGNQPIFCSSMQKLYKEHDHVRHAHGNQDTIDCDVLMNPTIVTSLSSNLANYLIDIHHKYFHVSGELMDVIHDNDIRGIDGIDYEKLSQKIAILNNICEENGSISRVLSYPEELKEYFADVSKLNELAMQNDFLMSIYLNNGTLEISFKRI